VLTGDAFAGPISQWLESRGSAIACTSVSAADADPESWRCPERTPDALAFLQYTSGSISDPKGVMVSHGNLLANLETIRRCLGTTSAVRELGWLPATHDMGLVGQLLSALYVGCRLRLIPPAAFLRHPHRWLELIGEFGANVSAAPNFAYDLCLRRVTDEQLDRLDLSTWDIALNGSEPVRAATLEAFADRFGRAGFRPAAFVTCYGMAEATLLVSATPRTEPPAAITVAADALAGGRLLGPRDGEPGRRLISSGRVRGCELAIVDPATAVPLADGRIGEIWIRGDCVAAGYWRHAAATRDTFDATTAAGDGGFLRTGDLGARLDGELYVTGRLKDVIVVRGRNLYPHDLEAAIHSVRTPASGLSAVFTLPDPAEHVVVVHEIKPALWRPAAAAGIVERIRAVLVGEFGIAPPSVVLVPRGAVRRTTSGKIQRPLTRQLFLDKTIDILYEDRAP
jgi:acyl-CoA synthetase (AMP-forming)/AMP-acid ligase II